MRWKLPTVQYSGNLVDRILSARGIDLATKDTFFNPDVSHLGDPTVLHDAKSAAEKISEAIKQGKKIFIHGDYDVDGVCATALMWDFLYRELEADVLPYIPSRFDEGYGLSESSIQAMLKEGAELITTVDCGVKDIDIVKKYVDQGIDFVITDHHGLVVDSEGDKVISRDALAVVHPSYPKFELEFAEICGTTVAWKLCCTIANKLELDVDMTKYLDLVALATVCDVMPLEGENRVLVALGIRELRKSQRVGIQALAKVAGIELSKLQTYQLGFTLGPRLNAAGRMESALDALRLLTTSSASQAAELANKLNDLNVQRQDLTQKLILEAESVISKLPADQKLYVVHGAGWPEGIIGLVAGKLTEKYHRPVLVGSQLDKEVKFSARSIPSFHITDSISKLAHLVTRFGGHAQAAGVSLSPENLAQFTQELVALSKDLTEDDMQSEINVDLILNGSELLLEEVALLEKLEPHGFGNPRPNFLLPNMELINTKKFGKENKHIKLLLRNNFGTFEALQFNSVLTELNPGDLIHLVVNAGINEWNGKSEVQMIIRDLKSAADLQID